MKKLISILSVGVLLVAVGCSENSRPMGPTVSDDETAEPAAKLVVSNTTAAGLAENKGNVGNTNPGSGTVNKPPRTFVRSKTWTSIRELRFDQNVVLGDLQIKWNSVNDTRCPTGVVCGQPESVTVNMEVIEPNGKKTRYQRVLRQGTASKVIEHGNYTVQLRGVTPNPEEGVTPSRKDFVARLLVRKVR